MSLVQQATSCAWCLEEQGQVPQTGSHGICQLHAEKMLADYYWQKLQSVPSYVETQAALLARKMTSNATDGQVHRWTNVHSTVCKR